MLSTFIQSNMSWELGKHYYINILPNIQASCYMAFAIQCMARIPALTRLLLETTFFDNLDTNSFLFR